MATISITVSAPDYQALTQEHEKHLAFIESIKNEVSDEYDNLNNPVPLFQQLEASS